jgi:hypothetical protein
MSVAQANKPSSTTIIYYLTHALLIAIGSAVTILGGPFWTAVGTSLIATGAAGAVIYIYLARTQSTRDMVELLSTAGLETIYDRRAAQIRSEYAVRLNKATSNIDILGFGLKDFRRDYIAELGALSARAEVRILLLDPKSPLAKMRDREEGQSEGTIRGEIEEFLNQYRQHYAANPPTKLHVRLYTCLPLVNVFRIDNDLFWGPYFAGRASGNTITIRVKRGGQIYDQLLDHFDEVWEKFSKPVDVTQ